MKLFKGWAVAAGLVFVAAAANAQVPAPTGIGPATKVSDVGAPYAAMPSEAPPPGYGPSYGSRLLPPAEVHAIAREAGFAPLGIPQQRGLVYTISVIDNAGDDGKLVIDARSGRIIRFIPVYWRGDNFNGDLDIAYEAVGSLPPPIYSGYRRAPRPPLPIPHVASRSAAPLPKAPPHARPEAAPPQQSAATAKPAEPPASPPSPTVGVAKPPVQIMPTQEMPAAQGF
ncbi:PepSY domain-containing protein [Bradyrhizobium sp.]